MKIIFLILSVLILLALLIVFMPLALVVEYYGKTRVKISIYGFKVYDSFKTEQKSQGQSGESAKKTNSDDALGYLKTNLECFKEILLLVVEKAKKYVIIKNIEVKYRFGLGDAAVTGIYSGGVYAVINGFAAYLRNYLRIRKQKLEVVPDFDNNVQEFEAKVELVAGVVFFMPVIIKILRLIQKKEV